MVKPVLELRWRAPELPKDWEEGKHIEVGFLRFQKSHYRITVAPVTQWTYVKSDPHPNPVPATAFGWGVAMNGDFLDGSALSFVDACYAAWAVFIEIVPGLAQQLAQAMAWEVARLDSEALFNAVEVYVEPGHKGEPTRRGGPDPAGDTGGAAAAGHEPARLRAVHRPVAAAGPTPLRVDGKQVGDGA